MSMGALVLAPFSPDALGALGHTLPVTYESWTDTRKLYSPEELSRRINSEETAVLVVEADFVFEEVFRGSTGLRFLGVCRNSLDHIDVEAATNHGVVVVNTPGRNMQAVAELTIGLMLCLARGIPRLNGYVHNGKWESPVEPYVSMGGTELSGKTLGLIGLGAIGRTVARTGRALGMDVVAYDPHVGAPGRRLGGALLVTLERLLRDSDFLSLHTSGNGTTNAGLDRSRLGMVKEGAYIVNTASYYLIDEAGLVDKLRSGHIGGVAIDVHRTHPILPSSPLLGLDNVILTPHIGGATDETVERQSWMMVEEIKRFIRGRRPRHLVNRDVWRCRG